jgi:uncharacterized glyoxalase superfamily protein PhnB
MKPTPKGWPRLSSALCYRDPAAMIDWLCKAFDFEIRIKIESAPGVIEHSELTYGDAVIMVGKERIGDARFGTDWKSPLSLGAISQSLFIYVDDVEAHCARARAAGANITSGPEVSDYGDEYWVDKGYGALDPENHLWFFSERLKTAGV